MSRIHAHAVLRGPAHVIMEASASLVELARRQIVGMPIAEAFPEEQYQAVIDLMDWVSITRMPIKVRYPGLGTDGVLTVSPTTDGLLARWSGRPVARPIEPPDEVGLAVARRVLEVAV